MTSSSEITENITAAEVEALKRRERIRQMKRKAQGQSENSSEEINGSDVPSVSSLSVADTDDTSTLLESRDESISLPATSDELDLNNLASRKVDWDLKRGIEKSLEILKERTNEIIAEIVRERSMGEENDD